MSWIHLIFFFLLLSSFIIYPNSGNDTILIFGNLAKIMSLMVASLSLTFTQNAFKIGRASCRERV